MAAACGTVIELLAQAAGASEQRGGAIVFADGEWRLVVWRELVRQACRLADGLAKQGIVAGDRVALAADNGLEWIVTDFAVQILRAVLAPLHVSLSGEQLAWQIEHSGSRLAVCHDAVREKLFAAINQLQADLRIVSLTPGYKSSDSRRRLCWPDLLDQGNESAGRRLWEETLRTVTPQTLTSIVYTSGTSSEPKGVLLTQGNLAANAQSVAEGFGVEPGELRLNSLPLSHAYARMSDLYVSLAGNTRLAIGRGRESLIADAQQVKPTLLVVVPLQLARLRQAALAQYGPEESNAVRKMLGGQVRGFISGGAPLDAELYDFFAAQGTPVWEGYGLTEAAPVVSLSSPQASRRNSVGRIVPGATARIADDGELLVRGPQVMAGYWRDDAASREALRDGWLQTGDLAAIDEEGFLFLKSRKREVIALASGKKVWAAAIEAELAGDALIEQIMLVGEGERALGALIVPRDRAVRESGDGAAERRVFLDHLATKLTRFADHEQVRRVCLLPDPWTMERGELTPKLTLRRQAIRERYADCIRSLFGDE